MSVLKKYIKIKKKLKQSVNSICTLENENIIASGSSDHYVKLWRMENYFSWSKEI